MHFRHESGRHWPDSVHTSGRSHGSVGLGQRGIAPRSVRGKSVFRILRRSRRAWIMRWGKPVARGDVRVVLSIYEEPCLPAAGVLASKFFQSQLLLPLVFGALLARRKRNSVVGVVVGFVVAVLLLFSRRAFYACRVLFQRMRFLARSPFILRFANRWHCARAQFHWRRVDCSKC